MSPNLNFSATMESPELVVDCDCETGENPLWHPMEKRLYWTDIPRGRLFRYDPASGLQEQCYQGRPVGGFTVQADGALVLFMDRGTIGLWRNGDLTVAIEEIAAERLSRFNDVIADPRGRVFCGTMSTDHSKGRLYRLDLDGTLRLLLEGIGCSNGMAFTPDRRGFYYTDSFAREIYLFDYEAGDGTISNRRIFARFRDSEGLPDGITVDAEGFVWCAMWDGHCILRLSGDGALVGKIMLPVPKASSLTFAGEDYSEIYITTAGGNVREQDGRVAGSLFRARPGIRGVPEFFSRIQFPGSSA
jgi:D-xylonolactonase